MLPLFDLPLQNSQEFVFRKPGQVLQDVFDFESGLDISFAIEALKKFDFGNDGSGCINVIFLVLIFSMQLANHSQNEVDDIFDHG